MKHVLRFPIFVALAGSFAFYGCSKEEQVAPSSHLSQNASSNGTVLDLRATEFDFPGKGAVGFNNYPINLTGLVGGPAVSMVRKNFIEAANGDKIFSTWNSKAPLNVALYSNVGTLPYQWTGKFYDHDGLTYGKVFDAVFQIDKFGNATATLKWTGEIASMSDPYIGVQ